MLYFKKRGANAENSLAEIAAQPIFAVPKNQNFIWSGRVGQGVKTPPFHGGITGSNPVRGTKPSL